MAFDPNDPSQWPQTGTPLRITVRPRPLVDPPPSDGIDGSSGPGQVDDGPDDWFVPPQVDDGPDDWFVPPSSAAPGSGQPSSSAPPNAAGPGSFYRPAAPPDPLAAYWSLIPASRVGAMAWDPPNLPLLRPSPANNFPAPIPSWPPPQAEISGAFSGASWAVFPARFFQGPVKHLVFQIFGAQPALAVGERVTRNIVDGRPATEGVGEAYGQGVVGTLTPALGNAVVKRLLPKRAPAADDRRTENTSNDADDSKTSRGVWDLPATKRGRILEKIFGHNLHPDNPTIDIWDQTTGAATSIKSIDLESSTYQVNGKNVNALYNKLGKAVNDLAEYAGGRYAGRQVAEHEIASRTLAVIVPGVGTAEQRQVLRQIAEFGRQRGVIVRIEVYR